MVQDAETNTNLDVKENTNILSIDSNKNDTIAANNQNINANNNDTDIQRSMQENSNQ